MLNMEGLRTLTFLLDPIKSLPLIALKFFYSSLRFLHIATQRASEKLAKISLDVYNSNLNDFACPSYLSRTQLEKLPPKTKIYNYHSKHRRQDIHEVEELFQLVIDTERIEICNWCLITNKIVPLKNYKFLFGLDSNTTAKLSKSLLDFVHLEDCESVSQTIFRCIEEKIDYNDEFRMVSPTGKIHWISARGKVHFHENGKATKIALVLKNIDDRWQAETSAINSEAKWRSLVQYSSEFITIIGSNNNSSDWAIEFVSFSIQRILGYMPLNLLGEDFLNLVHPSDVFHVITSLQQVSREPDGVIVIQYKYLSQTGSWYLIESSVSNHAHNSTILGVVLNSHIVEELTQLDKTDFLNQDDSRITAKRVPMH